MERNFEETYMTVIIFNEDYSQILVRENDEGNGKITHDLFYPNCRAIDPTVIDETLRYAMNHLGNGENPPEIGEIETKFLFERTVVENDEEILIRKTYIVQGSPERFRNISVCKLYTNYVWISVEQALSKNSFLDTFDQTQIKGALRKR